MKTMRSAAALAVLVVAGPAVVDSPAYAGAAAALRFGYEDGSKSSGNPELGFNECCRTSIQGDDLPRTGKYALRSQLKYGDQMVAGGTRVESHTLKVDDSYYGSGDTVYYGFM
ncbi:hypothetical protein ACBJ59_03690 [Nonomuraea sp. MTCD27]|uniref:hypothetical protein n=1 Tax=Nonomuraea sp. MTCD27 TaxID=1676747 RepID=UPI0035BF5EE2